MIYEIKKNELNRLNNTFFNKDYFIKEFENNPFGRVLIYEEDNKIVGYLYYSDIYDRVEINQFEIDFIHRNCGKGNRLLKEFIMIVDKDISLEVKQDNLPAIKLYEKNGFIKKAIRRGYYNGVDGILMERKKDSY